MSTPAALRFLATPFCVATLLLAACTTSPETASTSSSTAPAVAQTAIAHETDTAIPTDRPPVPLETIPSFDYAGDQQVLVTLEREIAAAGKDEAKLSHLAGKLTTYLRAPEATFAARQAIAQRLAQFPPASLTRDGNDALFTTLLADEKQFEIARLALEPAPGKAVDQVFLDALPNASGLARIGIVQSLGRRRVASAVAPIAPLARNTDPKLAAAAIEALGRIGTDDALAALQQHPSNTSPAIISAQIEAVQRIGGSKAIRTLQQISETATIAPYLRGAALRVLLDLQPADAPKRIKDSLAQSDAAVKAAVVEAIATHPSRTLSADVAEVVPSLDPQTQAAVITALGRRRDAQALKAIVAATSHADEAVRGAALTALGLLPGDAEIVQLLVGIAAGENAADARLARQSLSLLRGRNVDAAIVAGARTADVELRPVFIEQIASRYMTSSLPLLLQMRADPEPTARAAALSALAEIAPASMQDEVLAWTLAATDSAEQSRALRALTSITLRNPDSAARIRPIADAVANANSATATRLLPVLHRVGGASSAETVAQLAQRDDRTLAAAAASTLSRWNDQSGLLPLIGVAENTANDATRATAIQSATRFLERFRELPSADLTSAITRLLEVTRDAAARERLVFLLGRARDDAALALAEKLQREPALAAAAGDAIAAIRSNLAGAPEVKVSSGGNFRAIADGRPSTQWTTSVEPDRSVQLDLHLARPIRQLTLDQNSRPDNFPEHYEVFVTDDLNALGDIRASGSGTPNRTVIDLPAGTRGRYIVIRNTAERTNGWWTINELYID